MIKWIVLSIGSALLQIGCAGTPTAIHVNLYDLLNNPEAYHSKNVQFQGFLRMEEEDQRVYPTSLRSHNDYYKNSIPVVMKDILDFRRACLTSTPGHVVIEGIFDCPLKSRSPHIQSASLLGVLYVDDKWFGEYYEIANARNAVCDVDRIAARKSFNYLLKLYGENRDHLEYNLFDYWESLYLFENGGAENAKTAKEILNKHDLYAKNHPDVICFLSDAWWAVQLEYFIKKNYFAIEKHYFPDAPQPVIGPIPDRRD
jgi:hypothetical protein